MKKKNIMYGLFIVAVISIISAMVMLSMGDPEKEELRRKLADKEPLPPAEKDITEMSDEELFKMSVGEILEKIEHKQNQLRIANKQIENIKSIVDRLNNNKQIIEDAQIITEEKNEVIEKISSPEKQPAKEEKTASEIETVQPEKLQELAVTPEIEKTDHQKFRDDILNSGSVSEALETPILNESTEVQKKEPEIKGSKLMVDKKCAICDFEMHCNPAVKYCDSCKTIAKGLNIPVVKYFEESQPEKYKASLENKNTKKTTKNA